VDISQDLLEQILDHAREEVPNECCGVVAVEPAQAGRPVRAARIHRAVNAAKSSLRFEIDPLEVGTLIDTVDDEGLTIGAIYHSHLRTAPRPSQTDINFAPAWPRAEWIIVGLTDPEAPEIRSYLIEGGTVREVEIAQIAV
jgi:proteasome lid subunit RPN8/RPN11